MERLVIGFTGIAGAGKTTSVDVLKELLPNKTIVEVALASKLKQVLSEIFNVDSKFLNDPVLKEEEFNNPIFLNTDFINEVFYGFGVKDQDFDKHVRPHIGKILLSFRELMQYVGTDILRNYDSEIHCKKMLEQVNSLKSNELPIISDIRFTSEYEFCKNNFSNFKCFYLERFSSATNSRHISELEVKDIAKYCLKVDNKGNKLELKQQWDSILKSLNIT